MFLFIFLKDITFFLISIAKAIYCSLQRATDERSTSVVGTIMRFGRDKSPSIRCNSVLAAISPISACGMAIVVNGGLKYFASAISEIPITDSSSGIEILRVCNADIAAIAIWSLPTNRDRKSVV